MALGRYPIPPPSQRQLQNIFGPDFELNPAQYVAQYQAFKANYKRAHPNQVVTTGSDPAGNFAAALNAVGVDPAPPNPASADQEDPPSLSIFALLDYIVIEPPPTVPLGPFTPEFKHFVDSCLKKDPNERPDLSGLQVCAYIVYLIWYS